MRLHDARGDRVRAMRAYHAYAAAPQRELGVVPSAGDCARATRRCCSTTGARPQPRGAAALVGRADERARLTELWRAGRARTARSSCW